jgi:hypothetical protein
MVKKPSILIAIIISTALLLVTAKYYAGASLYNKNSVEYNWKNNYLANPFGIKAIDESENVPGKSYLKKIVPFFQFWFISY